MTTGSIRAVPHVTYELVSRAFSAVEQVKTANDSRLKQLKQPVVNREKAVAYLLYDVMAMDFPDTPALADKSGKRLREQLNKVEREIKSLSDVCAGKVLRTAPMDHPDLKTKLEADIAEILRAPCTALDPPPLPPPPPALMPPCHEAPEPSALTHVPELDDPRSPTVTAYLTTIYQELAEAREDLEEGKALHSLAAGSVLPACSSTSDDLQCLQEALCRHVPGLVSTTRHALSSLSEVTAEEAAFKAGCYTSLQSFDTILHDYLCLPSHVCAQWQYLQPNRPAYRVFVDREARMRQVFGLHR